MNWFASTDKYVTGADALFLGLNLKRKKSGGTFLSVIVKAVSLRWISAATLQKDLDE